MKKNIIIVALFAFMAIMNIDAKIEKLTGLEDALFAKSPDELELASEDRFAAEEGLPRFSGSAAQQSIEPVRNEDSLSKIPSGSTLYREVLEKKGEEKQQEKAPALPPRPVTKDLSKKQSISKSIEKPASKMTSAEIGALDVNNLSQKQKEELVQIALFSGLESNRNAARKVIEKAGGKKHWMQGVKEAKDEILNEFKKNIGYQEPSVESLSKKMIAIKPINRMTSAEIGALKYENLSSMEQEQLFEMALFSGLESNRSAARKVIDAYHKSKKMNLISWDKELTDILAG